MPRHEASDGGGASGWVRRWWRPLLGEVLATALLVWLGVASLMPVSGAPKVQLTHPALAFGFVVVANICAFGPASGAHMNPAVTLAAVVAGRMRVLPALLYVVAQLLGATLGFGGVLLTAGGSVPPPAGCTLPAPEVSAAAAALLEGVLTGVLALACCAVWAGPADDHTAPLKLGLVVGGLVYAGGHTTGASINPARSFAPALYYQHWDYQWVYWVGPLGGAALGAVLHRWVLTPPAPPRADVDLPLTEKQDQP